MPEIIEHPFVLEQMRAAQFRNLYHNSGAFGFAEGVDVKIVGWLGPEDSTIRAAAREQTVQVEAPFGEMLARLFVSAWRELIGGAAWVMPMSHWNYELEFGSREWLPGALKEIGVEASLLVSRNNAAALEFSLEESAELEAFIQTLLTKLAASDFAVVFPGRRVLCTVHHHQQLWWQTDDAALGKKLRDMAYHNKTGRTV